MNDLNAFHSFNRQGMMKNIDAKMHLNVSYLGVDLLLNRSVSFFLNLNQMLLTSIVKSSSNNELFVNARS